LGNVGGGVKIIDIFILEDHPLVVYSLKSLITNNFEDVNITDVSDLKEAYDHLNYNYDLLILDLNIKGEKSFDFLKESTRRNKNSKHVIFTSSARKDYHEQAFSYGVNGYILKESMPEDIIYALKSVMKGHTFIDPIFNDIQITRKKQSKTNNLTDREKELLRLVGEGMSNKEIADKLFITVNTVKKHVTKILEKTDLEDRTKVVMYCQNNYV